MINIFEEAFKANVALDAEKLNESLIGKKLVSEAVATDSYETKFRQLLADSDNLTTGYFGEKDTEISDFGFRLYSQAAAIDVEFDPKTEKYSVKITDEEDSDLNEERTGRGFNELIAELEDLTSDGYTWFMNLENAFDYYKLDESLEEDVNEVEIKTDDEEIEIHIDDEGKVDVDVSEPTESDEVEDIEEITDEEIEEVIEDEVTEEPVEEGLFGKKKNKPNKKSNDSNSNKEAKVTIEIYDEYGKTQFSHVFTEIPGKMSAEEQFREIIKSNGVLKRYKSSPKKDDWSYERKSNPPSPFDTDRYFNAASKIIREDIEECEDSETIKESISLDKIRFTESVDSFQPEDELMVVYNSDLDDEMTEEEIQAEAESLIGCDICKCGICGANYVCKEDEVADSQDLIVIDEVDVENAEEETTEDESIEDFDVNESLLFRHLTEAEDNSEEVTEEEVTDEEVIEEPVEEVEEVEAPAEPERVCPVCGATENQVLTATIAPIEDNLEDEVVEEETVEEVEEISEPVEDIESAEELSSEDEVVEEELVTEDIGSDGIFVTGNELVALEPIFYSNIDDLGWEQSYVEHFEKLGYIEDGKVILPRGTKIVVGEKAPSGNGVMITLVKANEELEFVYEDDNDERFLVVDTLSEVEESVETKPLMETTLEINESDINRLFTKFARENYENIINVRIKDGKLAGGQICLEGYVRTTSGKKVDISLVSEGFKLSEDTTRVKLIEKGPFTESAIVKSNRVPFVLECNISDNKINFTGLKYNYKIQESKDIYSVKGKVELKG